MMPGPRLDLYAVPRYHPASHFWSLQIIETALFGGIALALLALAAWWIHQRIASQNLGVHGAQLLDDRVGRARGWLRRASRRWPWPVQLTSARAGSAGART
jgi:hypothetical protein